MNEIPAGESDERGQGAGGRGLSRRELLIGAGAASFALLLAACGGGGSSEEATTAAATTAAPPEETGAADTGAISGEPSALPGVAGGPSGFDGAERYQYPADSAPGRAIAAAQQLKKDGKAPDTLVVGLYEGSVGNYTQPFPEGATPPAQLWEELTGIKVEFVPVDPAQAFAKATQMAATKDGSQNIVQLDMHSNGDLAEAGLLLDLSEYVDKYQPDWDDPTWGYIGGPSVTQLFNYYNGKPYTVASDGDFQIFVARRDLWEDSKEQGDFESKYGYPLEYPTTWTQFRDMAEFFHRPDQKLLGATDLRGPSWGWINYILRYVSTANPVQFYFDDQMNPLVNSEQGIQAFNACLDTTQFGSKDALTWIWTEQYANWGEGGAAMTIAFNNITKFMKKGGPFDTTGRDIGADTWAIPMPGWDVDGQLVRHTSLYYNASNGVNAYSPSEYHEVSYLFLQWVASGPIYTWLTANPAGYQDPGKISCIDDPLVREAYTPRTMDVLGATTPGTAPSIAGLQGANEYIQALDVTWLKGLSGQLSPEDTMSTVESEWNKITDRIGRDQQIAAWTAAKDAWPTVPDSAEGFE